MNILSSKHPMRSKSALSVWGSLRCALATAVVVGCSQPYEKETAAVSGMVTLDGKPMTTGTVMFVPDTGRAAVGVIEPDGTYRLSTYRPDDGALVGRHKVSVAIPEGSETRSVRAAVAIPPRYMSPESSGLTFEVLAGTENQADWKLTSAPP